MQALSEQDISEAIRQFGRAVLARSPAPPSFDESSMEQSRAFAEHLIIEDIINLSAVLEGDTYDIVDGDRFEAGGGLVRQAERMFARETDLDTTALQADRRLQLRHGLARILKEERAQYLHRLDDRLGPYQPSDELLRAAKPTSPMSILSCSTGTGVKAGPTFGEAVDLYVAAKSGVAWTKRTEAESDRILQLAAQLFGADKPIAAITKDEVRTFRDGLLTWGRKPAKGAKLCDLLGAPKAMRIGNKTAAKYFAVVTAAFAHWVNEGYLEVSPAGSLKVLQAKANKAAKREPFLDKDLAALFNSPMYSGCKGPTRRTVPGPHVIQDGYYWIPIVAALSGMRVTEIVQLTCGDVELDVEVPVFRVRGDPSLGQQVKTEAGWRDVPIHRSLLHGPFSSFLSARMLSGPKERLFKDVPLAGTGGAGGEFSKWFGRRLVSLGIKRPTLTFHSFRHRVVTELRTLQAPAYVIKAIVGHEGGDTTDGYGAKVPAATTREWIDRLNYLDHYVS